MASRVTRLMRASADAVEEAERALAKHGPKNTMDAPAKSNGDRLAILMEEVGEAAHELTYDQQGGAVGFSRSTNPSSHQAEMRSIDGKPFVCLAGSSQWIPVEKIDDDELEKYYGWTRFRRSPNDRLRTELVQVAAMALTWIAMIDQKKDED